MTPTETVVKQARHHAFTLQYISLCVYTRVLRFFALIQLWMDPLPPYNNPNVVRTDGLVASRDKGRNIRVRSYRPAFVATDETLPILINFHGSGFIFHFFGQDEDWCASVAEQARMLVIDADYRKAPEYPFPLGSEDAEDVALHVLSHIPHTTLSISGFSAGGSIALGLSYVLGPQRVHSIAAFYPSTKVEVDAHTITTDTFLSPRSLQHILACYILPGTDLRNPRLSVAFAKAGEVPAHVWISTGARDPLHDAARDFVGRLKEEGHNDATFVSVPGGQHAYDRAGSVGSRVSEIGREKRTEAVAFLKRSLKEAM